MPGFWAQQAPHLSPHVLVRQCRAGRQALRWGREPRRAALGAHIPAMINFKLPELASSKAFISRQFCSVSDPLSQASFSHSSPSRTLVKSLALLIRAHGNRLNFIQEMLPPGRFWFDWKHLHLRARIGLCGLTGWSSYTGTWKLKLFSDLHFKVKKRVPWSKVPSTTWWPRQWCSGGPAWTLGVQRWAAHSPFAMVPGLHRGADVVCKALSQELGP